MKIFLCGKNSFIGKNIYKYIKKYKIQCRLMSHNDLDMLSYCTDEDIVINTMGVNRADSMEAFVKGNVESVKNLVLSLGTKKPFLIHISSFMIEGFEGKTTEDLPEKNQWFIESKKEAEKYLSDVYLDEKLCVLRPSNIYGYDCKPYYNNILCSLVYEKIHYQQKIKNLNINCSRNFLSVDNLSKVVLNCALENKTGTWNVLSDNTVSLKDILNFIWPSVVPLYINCFNGENDCCVQGNKNIVIVENLKKEILKLEDEMRLYYNMIENLEFEEKQQLVQKRGSMVEISNLESKRLYKITVNEGEVRGNHYHYHQTEDFFVNSGQVVFMLAPMENADVIMVQYHSKNDFVRIYPTIIHTVVNDFQENISEIIISSTQEYIANASPDTMYVNLF